MTAIEKIYKKRKKEHDEFIKVLTICTGIMVLIEIYALIIIIK